MEEGTFVTGVDILSSIPNINPILTETKYKADEKTQAPPTLKSIPIKQNRSATAAAKSLQPNKKEEFPPISHVQFHISSFIYIF